MTKKTPLFEPREDYLYSNLGYFLLGKIIEKSTYR
ncbi:beta-lactamase family protein [Shewanella sp. D64]|nr:beta-lactamase family protein [Shewanella sp. D64]MEC4735938.1 beta-lactamase family protein [Shewanella sp. E94]WBJ98183.1 beta-lactamase family protein [Shewanella sp. MTB7]